MKGILEMVRKLWTGPNDLRGFILIVVLGLWGPVRTLPYRL
jgi:hypothetical protein